MRLLDVLFALGAVYLGIVSAYLLFISVGAFLMRKKVNTEADPLRMAVVVPAHNETLQIVPCVRRVLESDYPADRFAVCVVADNCDDATAAAAREAGATTFVRIEPGLPGKGQALDWFIKNQADLLATFDGIAIIDADTQVAPTFLREISASLSHPDVTVVQGYNGVSNPDANWRTALTYAGFALINGLRPSGRSFWGGTADLKGNGMAFRRDMLVHYGWRGHSIVEDIEFSMRLLLDGILVYYNPDAIVISEMPTTRQQAEPQRRRWESGRFQTAVLFVPLFLAAFLRKPKWRYLDAILELLLPPLSVLVLLDGVALVGSAVFRPAWALFFLACMFVTAVYVVAGLYHQRAPATVWRGLLLAPLFLLWKIPFYAGLMFKNKPGTWERTQRQAELDPSARGENNTEPARDDEGH